jgi:hypothetical protein
MLASLLAARRQSRHARMQVFAYQLAGLMAAQFAASLWPGSLFKGAIGDITWFGFTMSADTFFLGSLAAFIVWAIIGNHRLMRQELQFSNSPIVWIGFLIFMMAWVAGWVNSYGALDTTAVLTGRLYVAGVVAAIFTYIMIILDTKDPVLLRWIWGRFQSGQFASAFSRMPSWMWALSATAILMVAIFVMPDPVDLAARLDPNNPLGLSGEGFERAMREGRSEIGFDPRTFRILILAAFFFLVRDVFIVLAFNAGSTGKRGDFASIVTLGVLYAVIPSILVGLQMKDALAVVVPFPLDPAILTIVPPAIEAAIVAFVAFGRMSTVKRPAAA